MCVCAGLRGGRGIRGVSGVKRRDTGIGNFFSTWLLEGEDDIV